MSQTVALLVHEIMQEPERFVEAGDGKSISNGYYRVSLEGGIYGMGVSSYVADGSEREVLAKAISYWKSETGWQPKEIEIPPGPMVSVNMDVPTKILVYEDFTKSVRDHLKSFTVHGESVTFSTGIQKAISKLDSLLKPAEKKEGAKAS